jgi:predicted ArsR family transcriptional regulator
MSNDLSFRKTEMDLAAQAAGIGALADPVRRALYEYVAAQPDAVGREAAAEAVRVAIHTAKFHLDRLCDEGLLVAEYRRLSGKTGPGAGRPAKLYRRADRQFAVSLPERRYELAGHILATAVQRAEGGTELADALREAAYEEGHRLGEGTSADGQDLDRLAKALATQGFEPRVEGGVLVLANCPFDALAKEHTTLVCGLNQWYVQGTADGLGCRAVRADLAPTPGQCCIRARLNAPPAPCSELRSGLPLDSNGDIAHQRERGVELGDRGIKRGGQCHLTVRVVHRAQGVRKQARRHGHATGPDRQRRGQGAYEFANHGLGGDDAVTANGESRAVGPAPTAGIAGGARTTQQVFPVAAQLSTITDRHDVLCACGQQSGRLRQTALGQLTVERRAEQPREDPVGDA